MSIKTNLNRRIRPDVGASTPGRAGDGRGHGAHPPAGVTPGTAHALQFSHDVVQQDVAAAGRVGADHGTDARVRRQGRL